MYKGGGVRFTDNLVSLRPNYFIFIGYFKTGVGREVQVNPLNPLWICHCILFKNSMLIDIHVLQ